MSAENIPKDRTLVWPWFLLVVLHMLTLAPAGLGRLIYDIRGHWLPGYLAWFYWLGLLLLTGAGIGIRKSSFCVFAFGVVLVLLVLNFAGCVSVVKELGTVT